MAGIGGKTTGKLITVQAELPQDVDGILESVRRIILMGAVQTITLRDGEPITYQRLMRPGEEPDAAETAASFAELTLLEVVRNISMEEYEGGKDICSNVVKMFMSMEADGWVVTHVLVGTSTHLWDHLWGTPAVPTRKHRLSHFLGAAVELEQTLSSDVFILCGARTKHATIAEIGFALKGNVT